MSDKKVDLKNIVLDGRTFDLSSVLPLRVRDWKQLKKLEVFTNQEQDPMDRSFAVVMYVLKKADNTVADDFVDNLTLDEIQLLNDVIAPSEKEAMNRPT